MKRTPILLLASLLFLVGCGDSTPPETGLFPPQVAPLEPYLCDDNRSVDERLDAGELSILWGTIEGVEIVRDRYERFNQETSFSTDPCQYGMVPAARVFVRIQGASWDRSGNEAPVGLGLAYHELSFNRLVVKEGKAGDDRIRDAIKGTRYFPNGGVIGALVHVDEDGDYRTYIHRIFGVDEHGVIYGQGPLACMPGNLNGRLIQDLLDRAHAGSEGTLTRFDEEYPLASYCYGSPDE